MNRGAAAFFRMIQDELFEARLLHLARLTDPPHSMGNKDKSNLTIQNLPELIDDSKLNAEITSLIEIAKKRTEFCRDWRNRHIAHRDLKLALNDSLASQLDMASRLWPSVLKSVRREYSAAHHQPCCT